MKDKTYIDIKGSFDALRQRLNEAEENNAPESTEQKDAVPYTQQDDLYGKTLDSCKKFADFTNCKNPMLYYPETQDVTLSGELVGLGEKGKFQFRFRDTREGCYVWIEPLYLNDNTLRVLQVVFGTYKNWVQTLTEYGDKRPLSIKNNN